MTHYTLAIILSSLSDYNTSVLHLKFALMLDKEMVEAEELLKALKCIELLKKEKDTLEREVSPVSIGHNMPVYPCTCFFILGITWLAHGHHVVVM